MIVKVQSPANSAVILQLPNEAGNDLADKPTQKREPMRSRKYGIKTAPVLYLDDVSPRPNMTPSIVTEHVWRIVLMHVVHYRRRGLIAAASAALMVGLTLPVRAADEKAVIEPIEQLVAGLQQIMKAGPGTPFRQRFDMLAPIVDRTFDLDAILQESVGAPWSALAPDQQKILEDAFRRYTIATYVNSFDSYDGQRFEVKPDTRPVGTEQVVQTRIIPKKGDAHELDYVMREGGTGWRAVDVLADGSISRVAVQRSDFRRLLTRGGAQALADSLRSKSTDLSDGSA